MELDQDYWDARWRNGQTGWDLGEISPPIKQYFDQYEGHVHDRILIPGAGNAYEAEYLYLSGYTQVHVLDFSEQAMKAFVQRVPWFPVSNCHIENFFEHKGLYDLIVEQTFFCALPVHLRPAYVDQCFNLLKSQGVLAGLLFNTTFEHSGPPFGASLKDYKRLFLPLFSDLRFNIHPDSIKPRRDTEVFFVAKKH